MSCRITGSPGEEFGGTVTRQHLLCIDTVLRRKLTAKQGVLAIGIVT